MQAKLTITQRHIAKVSRDLIKANRQRRVDAYAVLLDRKVAAQRAKVIDTDDNICTAKGQIIAVKARRGRALQRQSIDTCNRNIARQRSEFFRLRERQCALPIAKRNSRICGGDTYLNAIGIHVPNRCARAIFAQGHIKHARHARCAKFDHTVHFHTQQARVVIKHCNLRHIARRKVQNFACSATPINHNRAGITVKIATRIQRLVQAERCFGYIRKLCVKDCQPANAARRRDPAFARVCRIR